MTHYFITLALQTQGSSIWVYENQTTTVHPMKLLVEYQKHFGGTVKLLWWTEVPESIANQYPQEG